MLISALVFFIVRILEASSCVLTNFPSPSSSFSPDYSHIAPLAELYYCRGRKFKLEFRNNSRNRTKWNAINYRILFYYGCCSCCSSLPPPDPALSLPCQLGQVNLNAICYGFGFVEIKGHLWVVSSLVLRGGCNRQISLAENYCDRFF